MTQISAQIANYRGKTFTLVKDCRTGEEAITLCRKNLEAGILSVMVRGSGLIQVWVVKPST